MTSQQCHRLKAACCNKKNHKTFDFDLRGTADCSCMYMKTYTIKLDEQFKKTMQEIKYHKLE